MPPRNTKSKFAPKPAPAAPVVVQAAPQRSEAKGSGTAPAAPKARVVTQDMIAQRAYEIYANRGYAAGDPTADWYEAERQLKAGL